MRNGRGPRTILRFIAIIAMNLFTINCACYIAVTVSAHADPRLLHLSRTVCVLLFQFRRRFLFRQPKNPF